MLPPSESFYTNVHPFVWLQEHFDHSEVQILISDKMEIDKHWSKEDFEKILSHRGVSSQFGVCDQLEGDMIYMPAFYGHATLNIEESIGMAYEFDRGDC